MSLPARGATREIVAWSLYDFANSGFATLVVTMLYAAFFTKAIAPDEITGTALWSRAIAVSGLAIALLSPPLGALADRHGLRKRFMLAASALCIAATFGLYLPGSGDVWLALALFTIANVANEIGTVFYNAFLPDIAPPGKIGRISGWAWGLGYTGGVLCTVLAMVGFVSADAPWFGLSKDGHQHIRATNLLVAVWYLVFAAPVFLVLRESAPSPGAGGKGSPFRQFRDAIRAVRAYPQVVRLLVARLLYNDGLITIFAFGGIYAQGTFGFSFEDIIVFGIALNTAAGLGAWAFGWLDDRLGGKTTVLVTLIGFVAAVLVATTTSSRAVFWAAGMVIGIFAGPNQSASRSLMGRFVPHHRMNEFFGFFAFSGKVTSFLGPLLVGQITLLFTSQRAGMSVVVLFFLLGGLLLLRVDEARGLADARAPGAPRLS